MGNHTSQPGLHTERGSRLTTTYKEAPVLSIAERLQNVESLNNDEIEVEEKGSLLGYGASAKVVKGLWKKTPVAVKRFFDLTSQEEFVNEVLTQSSLRHQNIAPFIGYTLQPMSIVTQYYSKGSLFDVLHVKQPPIYLSKALLIKIAKDVARGMIYLHSKGLVHRDLKPGNLLINSLSMDDIVSCVITDFGITREQSPLMTAGQGTPLYSAPEVFMGKKELHYSTKVDVFSFGIILWELWARKIPFDDAQEPVVDLIARGERPPIPPEWLPAYSCLMQNCWDQNPDLRPSFVIVLQRLEDIETLLPPEENKGFASSGRVEYIQPPGTSGYGTNSADRRSVFGGETLMTNSGNLGAPLTSSAIRSASERALDDVNAIMKRDERLEWGLFFEKIEQTYHADVSSINAMKSYIEEAGYVSRKKLLDLLKWFSPLQPEPQASDAFYQTSYQMPDNLYQECSDLVVEAIASPPINSAEADLGYTLSQMASILSADWFFGFISLQEASTKLAQQPQGTFLLRFSASRPGAYAFSLQNGNNRDSKTVIHWLITSEPAKKFKIFSKVYNSLDEIIQIHKEEPIKLQDGKSATLLANPCPRKSMARMSATLSL